MRWSSVETDLKTTIINLNDILENVDVSDFMKIQYQAVIKFCEYLLRDDEEPMIWVRGSEGSVK